MYLARTLLPIFLFACLHGLAHAAAPLGEASPLQTADAGFWGDYEGTRTEAGASLPLAAQVVAQGGGAYLIKLFPGLYDGSAPIGELGGKEAAGRMQVRGTLQGAAWSGAIEGDRLSGVFGEGGSFELKRVQRSSPTLGAQPPAGAVVLFDGTTLEHFELVGAAPGTPCPWLLLENGAMEVRHGGIASKQLFGDHKVHVEFRTPFKPEARGQERGNSGVYLQGRYEVQVLDSHSHPGGEGECGGIYGTARPQVNLCYPPLQWQTYDIEFRAPRFNAQGEKTSHAKLTVRHNGVLIHENVDVPEFTTANIGGVMSEPGPLHLQDHGNPVWFRNIWAVPLD